MRRRRIRSSGPFELFWLSPNGSDSNPGTQALPKRTHAALWQTMVEDYDFCGKSIVIGHDPGIYDGIDCRGQLLGGNSFTGQVHFYGNPATPGSVILQPISGQAIHLQGGAGLGAAIHVDGFKLDMSQSPNADMVTIEPFCELLFGNSIVGYNQGHHDFQVCVNASLNLTQDYVIDKGGSVSLTHLQQDPMSRISVGGDGKFGFLHVKVLGAPTYSQAFCSVDRATCYTMGTAWLGADMVKTEFDRGWATQGSMCIPVASVDGVVVGQLAVSQVLPWGATVTSVDPVERIVCLTSGITVSTFTGTGIAFGSRPVAHGKRYEVYNGGLISSNTWVGNSSSDYNWFPGDVAGTLDSDPGSRYK